MESETTPTAPETPKAEPVKPASASTKGKCSLTITLPDRMRDSLQAAADERGLGEEVPEFLKNGFFLAMHSSEGWVLKLKPVARPSDVPHPELPLA